jgi:putative transposase
MDLREAPAWTAQRASGNSPSGRADGDRESELGLHSPAGRIEESGPLRGAVLRAHWGAFMAADFFTTEVWTLRGLVTYYTVFVIELHSRRVHVVGSTPHPDEAFMLQIARHLTDATDGVLNGQRFLICDRDRKWSTTVLSLLETSGVRVIRTPFFAPNCNAHAERFVRSVKQECLRLNRVIPLGDRHFRRTLAEFVVHYHRERNHQGLGNDLIDSAGAQHPCGRIRRRQRIGGLLSYYYRAA